MKPYQKTRTQVQDLAPQVRALDTEKLVDVGGGAVRHCIQFDSGGERSRMCIVDTECYWE